MAAKPLNMIWKQLSWSNLLILKIGEPRPSIEMICPRTYCEESGKASWVAPFFLAPPISPPLSIIPWALKKKMFYYLSSYKQMNQTTKKQKGSVTQYPNIFIMLIPFYFHIVSFCKSANKCHLLFSQHQPDHPFCSSTISQSLSFVC